MGWWSHAQREHPVRAGEAGELAWLAGEFARGLTQVVRGSHDAILDAAYGAAALVLPVARPVQALHRGIAHAVFWGVDTGLDAASRVTEYAVQRRVAAGPSALDATPAQVALGILNGVAGDWLVDHGSPFALEATLRRDGRALEPSGERLASAYPSTATGTAAVGPDSDRLVVLVHGLVETDLAWRYRADRHWGDADVSYGGLLERDHGWRSLTVRYNTGQAVRSNGGQLADLLDRIVMDWPRPIQRIALVGHSMGGLVALTALAHDERPWQHLVDVVITLGSPREGAPLERAAELVEQAGARIPTAAWIGGLLAVRSVGIRDLHDPLVHPPLPAGVREYAVHATLTPDHWHPAVPRVGDGLVPLPRAAVPTVVLHGLHHLDLLCHPRVYELLEGWLAEPVASPDAPVLPPRAPGEA
jgi:pimeloyl-ACP methyl ester carboxylesterase